MLRRLAHGTRLVIATVIGWTFVVLGLVLLVTPGPGLLALAAGMAVLARHYHWAERVRVRVRERLVALRPGERGTTGTPVPLAPPLVPGPLVADREVA